MKNMFLQNFAMLLNKPATAHVKIRGHLTVFLPTDGNTCFDGTELSTLVGKDPDEDLLCGSRTLNGGEP